MIDGQLMTDNNAFDDQAYQNILSTKIDEAAQYQVSALIIDTSSLISVKRDISYSESGENLSTGINEAAMYKKIIEQIKKFA
jgi:biotin synthase-related radical SAM superfamily protein